MCGIAGFYNLPRNNDREVICSMVDAIAHRGPDGQTYEVHSPVALGHSRLAVIDIDTGQQPMTSYDGRYVIVFNGEIYNYKELRKELEKENIPFRTQSDTEVLVNAYSLWGKESLDKLIGMFSFAVLDKHDSSLFLARDRFGQKPMTYFWDGSLFAFASELKALTKLSEFSLKVDLEALDLYLALGYVPAPFGIFTHSYKLLPGHFIHFKGQEPRQERYWYPAHNIISDRFSNNIRELKAEFENLFHSSLALRLRSDVPIGLFLSGGIDSSAIAHDVTSMGLRLKAFTVAFPESQTDLCYAQELAKSLDLDLDIVNVAGNIDEDLETIFYQFDEPFADTSCIPSYYIAKAAHGKFKVILNGDGGDELFAGYSHYRHIRLKQFIKKLACGLGIFDGSAVNPWDTYLQSKVIFKNSARKKLYGLGSTDNSLQRFVQDYPFFSDEGSIDPLKRALISDRYLYLANDLMFKTDIALGAFGIEGRSPFIDHRLMSWSRLLPSSALVDCGTTKYCFREFYKNKLPDSIISRPKLGFGVPVRDWLAGPLQNAVKKYLPCSLLEKERQTKLIRDAYKTNAVTNCGQLWSLLVLAIWAKRYNATL